MNLVNEDDSFVYVVTANARGERGGFILSWLSPASLALRDPRLCLVVSKRNHTTGLILETRRLTVNGLAVDQCHLLFRFGYASSRTMDKFQGLEVAETDYGTFLPGSFGAYECDVLESLDVGDRYVLYCRIVRTRQGTGTPVSLGDALATLAPWEREDLRRKMTQDSQSDESMIESFETNKRTQL